MSRHDDSERLGQCAVCDCYPCACHELPGSRTHALTREQEAEVEREAQRIKVRELVAALPLVSVERLRAMSAADWEVVALRAGVRPVTRQDVAAVLAAMAIAVGSDVVYFDRFPLGPIIATWKVERETKTQWVCAGGRRFRKSDLYQVGVRADSYRCIATREAYDTLVAKRTARTT